MISQWCRKNTKLERSLLTTTAACFVIILALALSLLFTVLHVNTIYDECTSSGKHPPKISGDVCLTKQCVESAAQILSNMDDSVDPCNNFYEFACGGYVRSTSIPEDKVKLSTFDQISAKLNQQIRIILEEPIVDGEPMFSVMVKNMYISCMNTTKIEENGLEPLKNVLSELGGWPVVDGKDWDESKFDWISLLSDERRIGYSTDHFIDFSVIVDYKNSSVRIIDLDQPNLGLDREYLIKGLDDKDVQAYLDVRVNMAVLLGANREEARQELTDAVRFEIQLANYSLPQDERRNMSKMYNPMSIRQLSEQYKNIPWTEYINNLLPSTVPPINDDEIVNVDVPSYLSSFQTLMEGTPKRIQANYALSRVVAASLSALSKDARDVQMKYFTQLTGQEAREPRWKECILAAAGSDAALKERGSGIFGEVGSDIDSLSNAIGALYVRKHFTSSAKHRAEELVGNIRQTLLRLLEEVDWMDDDTRKLAIEKAQAIESHVGYPTELLDNKKLNSLYADLKISPDTYLSNTLAINKFSADYAYGLLRQPVNRSDWVPHGRPAIVNAFYSPPENSIQFPAGILQGIFFSEGNPQYLNYGAMGWVIGHELTHGFDDQGSQYDKDGNVIDWWKKDTKKRYLDKAQCIISQYSNYSITGTELKINGKLTQGENIADNGGIKEAYMAYQTWVTENGVERLLPGLNFTQNQMFWIGAANVWCNKYRPQALKMLLLTNVHSPGEYRVVVPFTNRKDFAADFKCPAGSKMNPKDTSRCSVW